MNAAISWKRVQLGNLIVTQKGFAFKSAWYCETGCPIVKVSDFTNDSVDARSLTKIPDEIAEKHLRYELREGDVVIQTVGSWPTNPASVVGKCIRVPRAAHKALLNQNAVRLSPSNEIENRYLYYSLRSPQFCNYIVGTAQGAANQAAITLDAIRSYDLTIPPLPIQRKIAAILSAYDDLIEHNLRRIKILEEMAQNLYREWFVKFRFPGHQETRLVDSSRGKIPEGWEMVPLGKLAKMQKEKFNEKLHAECPLLDLAKMQQGTLSLGETGNPNELKTSRIIFEEDDILFGSIRPYLHKVALAPYRGVTNTSVLVIRPVEKILQSFLPVFLSSIDTIRWADQHSTGTKMPVIKWESLQSMPLLLPSRSLLQVFESFVKPMLQNVKMESSRNQTLRRTRNLLLPKLISGEVDVSELDITLPGEVEA